MCCVACDVNTHSGDGDSDSGPRKLQPGTIAIDHISTNVHTLVPWSTVLEPSDSKFSLGCKQDRSNFCLSGPGIPGPVQHALISQPVNSHMLLRFYDLPVSSQPLRRAQPQCSDVPTRPGQVQHRTVPSHTLANMQQHAKQPHAPILFQARIKADAIPKRHMSFSARASHVYYVLVAGLKWCSG